MNRIDTLLMQEIINQMKHNNLDMFDEFYDLTKNQVYVTILSIVKNKMEAEDIMQDTYLRFLNNIHKYKNGTNVVAFIVTIARNLAINHYNKKRKEEFHDFSLYEDNYVKEESNTELLDLVYKTLSGDELDVFIMHVIDELKHKEIAKIMKKPLGTITWLYNKAVNKMKQKVGEENE